MERELIQAGELTIDLIEAIYQKNMDTFEEKAKSFISETNRGKDLAGMKKWNEYIVEYLEIDNIQYFNLYSE